MKRSVYDQPAAERLVPLIHSIAKEIRERDTCIAALEARIAAATDPERTDVKNGIWPELSIQRRELRRARQELAELGCRIDTSDPGRVLIPGADGALETGFTWSVDLEQLAPCTA